MKSGDINKVLVVDDEEALTNVIVGFLQKNGFRCQGTTDPAKALEIAQNSDFDLVISDIRMDGMDGIQLTREIRRTCETIDIIIMSAFTDDYAYNDLIDAGAVDFIGKPLSLSELKAKIVRVGRERRVLSELKEANEALQRSLADTELANRQLRHGIEERSKVEKELFTVHREIESLVSSIPLILIAVSNEGIIKRWNAVAERVFQVDSFEALELEIDKCPIPWDCERISSGLCTCSSESIALTLEGVRFQRADRKEGLLDLTISPIRDDFSQLAGFIIMGADVTEHVLLKRQLAQYQKLESIGQLAAGIAHEINTPVQYVGDNIRFLQESFETLGGIHYHYNRLLDRLRSGKTADDLVADIEAAMSEADLDYIREEIPGAINQALDGIDRISTIVRSMKEFSHPGSDHKTDIDINRAIENTITVARNEWKYVSDVLTDFDSSIPLVHCFSGEFNQVILNMIVNSAHAIAEKFGQGSSQKGTVHVSTRMMGELVEICISDNGSGIREDIKSKIFDPFFTTKDVGKGTGQGLAIAHSVIVNKHGGTIVFESKPGEGATFVITLPIRGG